MAELRCVRCGKPIKQIPDRLRGGLFWVHTKEGNWECFGNPPVATPPEPAEALAGK